MHTAELHRRSTVAPDPNPIFLRVLCSLNRAHAGLPRSETTGAPSCSAVIHHGHRRTCSDNPLSKLSTPFDAVRRVESSGGDPTAGDLTVGEQSPVKRRPLLLCHWHVGPVDPRVLAISQGFNDLFLFVFLDLIANFKNLYLELGVSKLSEPNFARFILMCTI
jgi:hypothetical protein